MTLQVYRFKESNAHHFIKKRHTKWGLCQCVARLSYRGGVERGCLGTTGVSECGERGSVELPQCQGDMRHSKSTFLYPGMPVPSANHGKRFGGGWTLLRCRKSGTQLVLAHCKGYNVLLFFFFFKPSIHNYQQNTNPVMYPSLLIQPSMCIFKLRNTLCTFDFFYQCYSTGTQIEFCISTRLDVEKFQIFAHFMRAHWLVIPRQSCRLHTSVYLSNKWWLDLCLIEGGTAHFFSFFFSCVYFYCRFSMHIYSFTCVHCLDKM